MRASGRLSRRAFLAGSTALAAARGAEAQAPRPDLSIDMHSHAGRINRLRGPFEPVAEPMRAGGMRVACFAMVADSPVTVLGSDGRYHPTRTPRPGELAEHGRAGFARLLELSEQQRLRVIDSTAALMTVGDGPAMIVAAEGGDFLEGSLERLDETQLRYRLRHVQLTHFRVNDLGDIQTEAPVHGGLTAFGASVVRACNRKGIVVDVAHATMELVKQAAEITAKPLVLSHSALGTRLGARSRLISAEHAKLVAGTGGVIGLWPPKDVFRDLAAYAQGFARMAEAVGVEHVGFGSDLVGIPAGAAFEDYRQLPDLAAELRKAGFAAGEVGKILGGNYLRVFAATVG